MSLVERDVSKPAKKIKTDLGFYKYKFPEKTREVLKDLLPSVSDRVIIEFGVLSNRDIAYEMTNSSCTNFFNIFEFLDRLNLALVKLGITFSLVHVDESTYSLTTHYVKKNKNSHLKKDKSTKMNVYVDITQALEKLMHIYLERKKFVAGATCY